MSIFAEFNVVVVIIRALLCGCPIVISAFICLSDRPSVCPSEIDQRMHRINFLTHYVTIPFTPTALKGVEWLIDLNLEDY